MPYELRVNISKDFHQRGQIIDAFKVLADSLQKAGLEIPEFKIDDAHPSIMVNFERRFECFSPDEAKELFKQLPEILSKLKFSIAEQTEEMILARSSKVANKQFLFCVDSLREGRCILACDVGKNRYFKWAKRNCPNDDLVLLSTIEQDLQNFIQNPY